MTTVRKWGVTLPAGIEAAIHNGAEPDVLRMLIASALDDADREALDAEDRARTAEARVRELEAALNDALAEMEAGDAPDMRWLPANPSDLFGMVSNRYRSVYAILDAARQAEEVE